MKYMKKPLFIISLILIFILPLCYNFKVEFLLHPVHRRKDWQRKSELLRVDRRRVSTRSALEEIEEREDTDFV